MAESRERWNHNLAYHRLVFDALPADARAVLDVGCGEGVLCRRLRSRVSGAVVGLDRDRACIELARAQDPHGVIEYRCEDLLGTGLAAGSFDLVASLAVLHHLDAGAALRAMAELLRPGGRLVVVGLARSRLPRDLPWELAGALVHRGFLATRTLWESPAPTVWPPEHGYAQVRHIAAAALPGVRFRRRVLWRYSLDWRKPGRPGT